MVYVDKLFQAESKNQQAFACGERHGHQWCHMWCDGDLEELHCMARSIGLKKQYFQSDEDRKGTARHFPHYDLVPTKRELAITYGATEVSLREWILSGSKAGPAQGELGF